MYELPERKSPSRRSPLPAQLRTGLEAMSGHDLGDVNVHYDSPLPASVGARATTQAKDIHLAPGQEQHLAHEGWHVVQQLSGRVAPTTSVGGVAINDQTHLEHEADTMGSQAMSLGGSPHALQRLTDEEHAEQTPAMQLASAAVLDNDEDEKQKTH